MAYDMSVLDQLYIFDLNNGDGLCTCILNWIMVARSEERVRPGDKLVQRIWLTDNPEGIQLKEDVSSYSYVTKLPYCPPIVNVEDLYQNPGLDGHMQLLPSGGDANWHSFNKQNYKFNTTGSAFVASRGNTDPVILGVESIILNTNDVQCPAIPTTTEEFQALYASPNYNWKHLISCKYFQCELQIS